MVPWWVYLGLGFVAFVLALALIPLCRGLLKRLFDIAFSFIGLILLSPFLIFIAILIKWDSRGPVFYRGMRVGRLGKLFKVYKFRTMVANAEEIGGTLAPNSDSRITKIGKCLRRYKLDELPQLINVLKGDMSLVGPRPELPARTLIINGVRHRVDMFEEEEEKKILLVRPGMTDYSSIKFYNEGEILLESGDPEKAYMEKIRPEKIRLQLWYVNNHSMLTDLKIIFWTLKTIVFR